MSLNDGLQIPYGIQPVNPVPVDTWSGPFTGDSYTAAAAAANNAIPPAVRFISMGVRLIVDDVPKMYWYSGGIANDDLVEFVGEAGSGSQGFQGFQGPAGSGEGSGSQGFQGFQGNIGITGTQGFQGFQGLQGFQGFQGPKGSGKYFYGPTAPDSSDEGLTMGSKWFNTNVGAEFTYIVETDGTTQWVMVNVFSATGPQGPAGTGEGSGSQGFQGFQGPAGSGEGSGSQGFQGFQGFQGNIGITGTQGFQGFQGFQGNIGITGTQGFQGFQGPAGVGSGDGFTFPNNLPVNIAIGKTFGKYQRGDTIPALGKTIPEVLDLALNENIPPTVTLTTDPTTVAFNNTSPSITVSFGYEINSPGATAASASLDFKLNSAAEWTSLTTGTLGLTSFSGSYTHTPTLPQFNTSNLNYRYVVEDSAGETDEKTFNVTQSAYFAPTVTWAQSVVSGTTTGVPGESTTKRERGNRSTRISGSFNNQASSIIISSSPFVPMTDWIIERQNDRGGWNEVSSDSGLDSSSISIPPFTNDANSGSGGVANPKYIRYRMRIKDIKETNFIQPTNGLLSEINLKYVVFYGPTASVPSTSAEVRSVPNKVFSDVSENIDLYTGTSYRTMFVAYPQDIELIRAYNVSTNSLQTDIWLLNASTQSVTTKENNLNKTYNTYYSVLDIPPSLEQLIGLTSSGTETD